jgi:hypothetical protein
MHSQKTVKSHPLTSKIAKKMSPEIKMLPNTPKSLPKLHRVTLQLPVTVLDEFSVFPHYRLHFGLFFQCCVILGGLLCIYFVRLDFESFCYSIMLCVKGCNKIKISTKSPLGYFVVFYVICVAPVYQKSYQ